MKPEILIISPIRSVSAMKSMELNFICHHLWSIPKDEQHEFIRQVGRRIRGVITVGPVGIDAALLDKLPQLEIVAINSAGFDKLDIFRLSQKNIRVTNTPDVLTDDVADLGVLLLLAASRRLLVLDRYVRTGAWEQGVRIKSGHSIKGKVAGIFGFGRIGQALAVRLSAMGMQLRYFQPRPLVGVDVPRDPSLIELSRRSDFLILCAPANDETRGIVDSQVLAALGPRGILVNIARGSLVHEQALINALRQKTLGAAALDVFEHEPAVPKELCSMENVILTPHAGSATEETQHAMGRLTVDNLLAYFQGKPLLTPIC